MVQGAIDYGRRAVVHEFADAERRKIVILPLAAAIPMILNFQTSEDRTHAWSDRDLEAMARSGRYDVVALELFDGILEVIVVYQTHRSEIEILRVFSRSSFDLSQQVRDFLAVEIPALATKPFRRQLRVTCPVNPEEMAVWQSLGFEFGEATQMRRRIDFRRQVRTQPRRVSLLQVVEGTLAPSNADQVLTLKVKVGEPLDAESYAASRLPAGSSPLLAYFEAETAVEDPNVDGWQYEQEPLMPMVVGIRPEPVSSVVEDIAPVEADTVS